MKRILFSLIAVLACLACFAAYEVGTGAITIDEAVSKYGTFGQ